MSEVTARAKQTVILHVDDHPTTRYAIGRILGREGFRVMEAATGREALRLAKEGPDLIILDVNLPDIGGFEVCRRIKANPTTATIPVLHLSATYVTEEAQATGLESGADGYLVQPVDPHVLVATVKALLRLGRAEEELNRIVTLSPDLLCVAGLDGYFKRVNPAFEETLGYTSRELLARPFIEFVHPEDRGAASEEVARLRMDSPISNFENRFLHKDGSYVWLAWKAVPAVEEGLIYAAARDVTESKRVEAALAKVREAERRRMARELHDGVLQDLAYTVQAMQYIKLNAEGTGLEEELQKQVNAIRNAVHELRVAVHNLRLADDLDQPFPMLLESLVERNRAMVQDQQIGLEVEEGFPSAALGEDGIELLRILQEALTNARRHSGARNVLVSLKREGNDLVGEVSDDGRGFGPEIASGVGLRSMRERASALGGRLEAESEPGEGTMARIRVPLRHIVDKDARGAT
jgi:PAS domain S-box-containing protein